MGHIFGTLWSFFGNFSCKITVFLDKKMPKKTIVSSLKFLKINTTIGGDTVGVFGTRYFVKTLFPSTRKLDKFHYVLANLYKFKFRNVSFHNLNYSWLWANSGILRSFLYLTHRFHAKIWQIGHIFRKLSLSKMTNIMDKSWSSILIVWKKINQLSTILHKIFLTTMKNWITSINQKLKLQFIVNSKTWNSNS